MATVRAMSRMSRVLLGGTVRCESGSLGDVGVVGDNSDGEGGGEDDDEEEAEEERRRRCLST